MGNGNIIVFFYFDFLWGSVVEYLLSNKRKTHCQDVPSEIQQPFGRTRYFNESLSSRKVEHGDSKESHEGIEEPIST